MGDPFERPIEQPEDQEKRRTGKMAGERGGGFVELPDDKKQDVMKNKQLTDTKKNDDKQHGGKQ